MPVLAIDSSLGTSVAIVDDQGEVMSELTNLDRLAHTEIVGSFLKNALLMAGLSPAELNAVVVGNGPGPFTGLRVGIAAAKGFAGGARLPIYGISSLDALAFQYYHGTDMTAFRPVIPDEFTGPKRRGAEESVTVPSRTLPQPSAQDALMLVTDARRREVFSARYRGLDETGLPIREGDITLLAGGELPDKAVTVDWLSASNLVRYFMIAGESGNPLDPPQALYIRQPDVTLSAPKRVS